MEATLYGSNKTKFLGNIILRIQPLLLEEISTTNDGRTRIKYVDNHNIEVETIFPSRNFQIIRGPAFSPYVEILIYEGPGSQMWIGDQE